MAQLKHSHVPITPYPSYRGCTTKSTVDAAVTLLLFLELSKKHGFWTFCTGTLGGFQGERYQAARLQYLLLLLPRVSFICSSARVATTVSQG